jgi:outer membrane protein TolC
MSLSIHQNRNVWVVLSLAACAFLTACNPAPKYARPPAVAPTAFKEAVPQEYKEGAGWKLAQPGDDKLRGKWWELYKDGRLSALEEQVAINNQTIALAEANFRAARSLVAYARASLFPSVTTSPGYTRSRFSQTSRGPRLSEVLPSTVRAQRPGPERQRVQARPGPGLRALGIRRAGQARELAALQILEF